MLEDPVDNVTLRKWRGTITSEAKQVTMAAAQADFVKRTSTRNVHRLRDKPEGPEHLYLLGNGGLITPAHRCHRPPCAILAGYL